MFESIPTIPQTDAEKALHGNIIATFKSLKIGDHIIVTSEDHENAAVLFKGVDGGAYGATLYRIPWVDKP